MSEYPLINVRQPKVNRNSINACLVDLGAPVKEVYTNGCKLPTGVRGGYKTRKSIYDRYTIGDLFSWIRHLYHTEVKRYHHDLTGDEEEIKRINVTYTKAKKILTHRAVQEIQVKNFSY